MNNTSQIKMTLGEDNVWKMIGGAESRIPNNDSEYKKQQFQSSITKEKKQRKKLEPKFLLKFTVIALFVIGEYLTLEFLFTGGSALLTGNFHRALEVLGIEASSEAYRIFTSGYLPS